METSPGIQNNEEIVKQYIDTLNEKEKKALHIAKDNLYSSFDIEKSIGFLKWKEKNILVK